MCGILGYVGYRTEPKEKTLRSSLQTLEKRGPDSSSTWAADEVWFGHTRLSIIDQSGGSQPMVSQCGRIVVIYNGEIYNYNELKTRYRYPYRTRCDTEILIAGYLNKGMDFLNDIRGMYAFSLYDVRQERIFISRDPFGIKPLMYWVGKKQLVFASEIKALLPNMGPIKPHRPQIHEYVGRKFIPSPGTAYKDIKRLGRGETLEYDTRNHTCQITCFWDSYPNIVTDSPDKGRNLKEAVRNSVKRHMVSDVPVSLFLSGGVDSSVLAASLPEKCLPLTSYTVGLSGELVDEDVTNARLVASRLGLEHKRLSLGKLAIDDIVGSIAYFDEPFADTAILATNMLAKAASEATRVVLTGDGGDEMYYGYPVYRQFSQAGEIPRMLYQFLIKQMAWSKQCSSWGMRRASNSDDRYTGMYYGIPNTILENLLGEKIRYTPSLPEDRTPCALRNYDLEINLPDYYLHKIDKLSMYHSLEVRVPFLDLDVFSAVQQFNADNHYDQFGSKAVLRSQFSEDLPDSVFSRRKQGMQRNWKYLIGDHLAPLLNEYINSELLSWLGIKPDIFCKLMKSKTLLADAVRWRLLVLGIWLKHNRKHILLT